MANLLFGSISQTEEMCSIIYANDGESLMLFIQRSLSLSFSRYDLNILIFFCFTGTEEMCTSPKPSGILADGFIVD